MIFSQENPEVCLISMMEAPVPVSMGCGAGFRDFHFNSHLRSLKAIQSSVSPALCFLLDQESLNFTAKYRGWFRTLISNRNGNSVVFPTDPKFCRIIISNSPRCCNSRGLKCSMCIASFDLVLLSFPLVSWSFSTPHHYSSMQSHSTVEQMHQANLFQLAGAQTSSLQLVLKVIWMMLSC